MQPQVPPTAENLDVFFGDDTSHKCHLSHGGDVECFGGILIPAEHLPHFCREFEVVLDRHGVPPGNEVKWSIPRDNWMWENLRGDARQQLYLDLIALARACRTKIVAVIWYTGLTTLKGEAARMKCVEWCFERITMNLEDRSRYAIAVSDRGGGADNDKTFLDRFFELHQGGTEYIKGGRVIMNALTTPSRYSRPLQLADVVVSVTTAMAAGKPRYARPVLRAFQSMFITDQRERMCGRGLKVWPDETWNMYHWILRREMWMRWRGKRHYAPHPLMLYPEDPLA